MPSSTSPPGRGILWGRGILTGRSAQGILTGILTGALALTAAPEFVGGSQDVIVRGADLDAVAAAVTAAGGDVELEIGLIDAVSATVPTAALDRLQADTRVDAVTPDTPVQLTTTTRGDVAPQGRGLTPVEAMRLIGGKELAASSFDGTGIDVAVIDSGIDRNAAAMNVVDGVDVSFEAGTKARKDGYGHGTAMAAIIAGQADGYRGVAPDARLIDVKVADKDGIADISQVLAGIDWVVSNRNTDGRNIRVMNLAFGTDGTNPYETSPLAYAVEAAWRHDIVVVAAAGNHGNALGRLTSPAIDPYVIAVGAVDLNRTADPADDTIPSWSATGDGVRNPDIVAPGRSILGGKSAGSKIDTDNPDASERGFLLGSGTSQATAFVSGVVASMLENRPELSPDQVKLMLMKTARDLPKYPATHDGHGALDLETLGANLSRTPRWQQQHPLSDGSGPLDGDRGSFVLEDADGNRLTGDNTVVGEFDREAWKASTWSGSTWSGSTWSGSTWSGSTWSASTWSASTWSASTWSASTWSSSAWSAATWG